AAHQQQILFGVDAHDAKMLDRERLAAHAARQALALDDARGIRRGADRAGLASHRRTVRGVTGDEPVAFDHARAPATLGDALHVHALALFEDRNREALPHFHAVHVVDAELAQMPRRRKIALLELPEHRAREALLLVGAEAELHGRIAVTLRGAYFRDGARPG